VVGISLGNIQFPTFLVKQRWDKLIHNTTFRLNTIGGSGITLVHTAFRVKCMKIQMTPRKVTNISKRLRRLCQ